MDETTKQPHPLMVFLRAVWHVVIATAGAYGLSLTGFFLLRWLFGESLELVAVINNLVHLMMLPSLVVMILALGVRRWTLLVVLALPFVLTVRDVVSPLFNQPRTAPDDAIVLNVLTYNLYARDFGFDATVHVIREADADVVLMQEVGLTAGEALTELADVYPYMALHPNVIGTQGAGILSRYPIVEDEYSQYDLPVVLGNQRAELDINGTVVVVYNVHPPHPFISGIDVAFRSDDLMMTLARAQVDMDAGRAVLMAGDFNMTPKTQDYQTLAAVMTDSYGDVGRGLGYTFPNFLSGGLWDFVPPLSRLDYVFHNDHWLTLDARVWPTSGNSDHRPLWVELALLD